MRKVTNSDVLAMNNAIIGFEQLTDKVPFKLTYAVAKHKDIIKKHCIDFEAARIAICEELADKEDEKPIIKEDNSYQITPENLQIANDRVFELLNEEVEVPDYQVSISDLPNDFSFSRTDFPNGMLFLQYLCRD